MGHLVFNFINNGFEDLESVLIMMNTELALDKIGIERELGIDDIRENSRLFIKLKETADSYLLSSLSIRYGLSMRFEGRPKKESACGCLIF